MQIGLIFSTTEGQTRKIIQFAFDQLARSGHSVAMIEAKDAEAIDLSTFDAVIMAASVHVGQFQKEMTAFATAQSKVLNAIPTLFLSVSLAAAGDDAKDWEELGHIVDRFAKETGFSPKRVEHVAGAFKFTDYDFFKYWAMRWIESKKDPQGEAGTDREYTDWNALEAILKDWTNQVSDVRQDGAKPV